MKTFNKEVEDCIQKSRYNEAAELVAQKLGLEWTINFLKNDKHFEDDKDVRDIYKIGLKRGSRNFHFNFLFNHVFRRAADNEAGLENHRIN